MSKLFSTILPSMIAGGLVFGSALTQADDGRSLVAYWPAASDAGGVTLAQAPVAPRPPTPPRAPAPPRAPRAPHAGHGPHVNVDIDLGDIDEMVDEHIRNAIEAIRDNDSIPAHVRGVLEQRLHKARNKVKKRIAKVNPHDLDQLGKELEAMGEELGEEMEQFGKEMEKWGKDFERKMGKKLSKKLDFKLDLRDDLGGIDLDDADDLDDLDDAIRNMGSIQLQPNQRAALKRLRQDSEAKVASAKRELDRASETLRRQLENPGATEAEISRSIDQVTKLEADIRKARILAWVNARKVLDDAQRKRVEAAAKGRTR